MTQATPIIRRPLQGTNIGIDTRLKISIPFQGHSWRPWLYAACGRKHSIEWDPELKVWRAPASKLVPIVTRLMELFDYVDVYLDVRNRGGQEVCTNQCQSANPSTVYTCVCCCGGKYHGGGGPLWKNPIGDFLISAERDEYTVLHRCSGSMLNLMATV